MRIASFSEGEGDDRHVMVWALKKNHTDDQAIQALRSLRSPEMTSISTSSKSPDSHIKKRECLIVTKTSQRHLCVQRRLLSPCAMSEGDVSSIVPILIRTFSLPNTALPIPPWRTCAWVEGYNFVHVTERYSWSTSTTPIYRSGP